MRSDVNVDVNRRNEKGAPGIWVASRYGHFSVVELLLHQGAEFDIWVSRYLSNPLYGSNPLYEAGVGGHANIVALLLSRGADASARFMGRYAYSMRYRRPVYPRIHDADETLLHAIAHGPSEWGSEPMDELKMSSIVSSLLKHGASIEAINVRSKTPLHVAVSHYQNPTAVSILLHHGASLGALNESGYTPLMHSTTSNSTAALEQLLKKVSIADIVYRNRKGQSALSLSLRSFKPDAIMLLLNTVDLRAARELGTQSGDEFVELSQVLKGISHIVLSREWNVLNHIGFEAESQRSLISFLQAIAEKIVMGKVDWYDANLRNKLRKERVDLGSDPADPTNEEEEADVDDNEYTDDGNDVEDEDGTDDSDDTDDGNDVEDDDGIDEEDDIDDDSTANEDNNPVNAYDIHDDNDKDYEDL